MNSIKNKMCFLATAVGSLPHDNPEKALDLLFEKFPDFPLWPQLANVSPKEDMIAQLTENIPGIFYSEKDKRYYMEQESEEFFEKLEEFFMDYETIISEKDFDLLDKYAIRGDFSSSIPSYLERIKKTKPLFLKGQITGPFTYATSLVDTEKRCAFYDEALKEILIKGLTLKALWQVIAMKKASPTSTPVIFLDEPSISQFGSSAFITITKDMIVEAINEISSVLKENGAMVGVHCCGKTDWSIITDSDLDVLNFDGYYFGESLSLYAKDIEKFLKKGSSISWGMVPTLDKDALQTTTLEDLEERFIKNLKYLTDKGIDEKLILNSSFITPACGCGSLSMELSDKALDLTDKLAKRLKEKYCK